MLSSVREEHEFGGIGGCGGGNDERDGGDNSHVDTLLVSGADIFDNRNVIHFFILLFYNFLLLSNKT